MNALANALKDEIRRLARKEIRVQTGKTSKAVAQYRREIARLKRQQRDQTKKLAMLETLLRAPSSDQSNGSARFSSKSVKAQRRRTGLSAADFAKLVGVSSLTIYNWESGKARPRQAQLSRLVALRGLGKREAKARLALVSGRRR